MIRHLAFVTVLLAGAPLAAAEADWIFKPSYFSHDPTTGRRVTQYAPGKTPYARVDERYLQSGYRQQRIRIGGDNIHVVETWGAGEVIRPYGEWLRPFRAGATPYGPWGNPQGPWTSPFGSWSNPYGLGQLPSPPWFPYGFPSHPGPPHGGPPHPGPPPAPPGP